MGTSKDHPLGLVIPDQVGEILIKKQQTVAVAESVTAGHLQVAFSLARNAMNFFQGGITVYNLGQKTRHLHVDPIQALACNCVSEKTSQQMAENLSPFFSSDWAIAVTGYASPVPEEGIERLFACYSIYFRGNQIATETIYVENNSPLQVRIQYVNEILKRFKDILLSK